MYTIKVKVTQSHIDKGARGSCWKCPIALALIEATNLTWRVYDATAYYYRKNGAEIQIMLPFEVSRFVKNFDKGEIVKPFEFEVVVHV